MKIQFRKKKCFADVEKKTVSLRTTQNTLVDQNTFIFLLAICQVHCRLKRILQLEAKAETAMI